MINATKGTAAKDAPTITTVGGRTALVIRCGRGVCWFRSVCWFRRGKDGDNC